MILNAFRYVALLLIFFSFGCGLLKTTHNRVNVPAPEVREPEVTEEDTQPAEIASVGVAIEDAPEAGMDEVSDLDAGDAAMPPPVDSLELQPVSSLPDALGEEEVSISAEDADTSVGDENEAKGQDLLDAALDYINSSQEYWAEGDPDRAIAILDEAYSLVVKVDTDENPELFRQKEDLRYMISKRILEIYASRYTATNGNHNEIPLTLNEYVEKEIKRFQGSARKDFIASYRRSGRYMTMILQELKEAGLPEGLAWLPLIESGFKVDALSSARALGMWQFIASTGQKFGLKRDTYIDERLDPEKATAAAIAYLQELHQIFGDWTTVLAGYNCGEGAVLRKIRSQKINYLDNFWDLFQMLPYETARYVPRFLATLHILKDPAKYGFDLGEPDSPVAYETVPINKPVQLSAVAETIGVPAEELSALNPELRHKSTPPTEYSLKVPVGKSNVFLARIDDIPDWSPPTYETHIVRKGESLSVIARKYGTSVSRIVLANNIREKHLIRVGQKLKVPLKGTATGSASTASRSDLLPGGKYRVKKGDTLWLIANKFKTNTKKIQQINGLTGTLLSVGQILIIPQ
ncbi:MAG: LysM peptidoglycan-binding domain-containing protein [Acidobacteria bacterium]|nr:LysM peptidoglycan-binding domain-containing protein [Acidobacteriota bacterium]